MLLEGDLILNIALAQEIIHAVCTSGFEAFYIYIYNIYKFFFFELYLCFNRNDHYILDKLIRRYNFSVVINPLGFASFLA